MWPCGCGLCEQRFEQPAVDRRVAGDDGGMGDGSGAPARSVTMPPASRTMRIPAAMSQGASFELPESFEPAARDVAQIERRGARRAGCRSPGGSRRRTAAGTSAVPCECENGNPVPIRARDGSVIGETAIGSPVAKRATAERWRCRVSSLTAWRTTPAVRTPSTTTAIETAYCG